MNHTDISIYRATLNVNQIKELVGGVGQVLLMALSYTVDKWGVHKLGVDEREPCKLCLVNVGDDQLVWWGELRLGACEELVKVFCSFSTLQRRQTEESTVTQIFYCRTTEATMWSSHNWKSSGSSLLNLKIWSWAPQRTMWKILLSPKEFLRI